MRSCTASGSAGPSIARRGDGLPDGVVVATDSGPAVVLGGHLAVWNQHDNIYRDKLPRPISGTAAMITPPSSVQILRAGYPAQIDDSALWSR